VRVSSDDAARLNSSPEEEEEGTPPPSSFAEFITSERVKVVAKLAWLWHFAMPTEL